MLVQNHGARVYLDAGKEWDGEGDDDEGYGESSKEDCAHWWRHWITVVVYRNPVTTVQACHNHNANSSIILALLLFHTVYLNFVVEFSRPIYRRVDVATLILDITVNLLQRWL